MNWPGLLKTARGEEPADLVLKGGRIVNVFTGEIERADLAVRDGLIAGLGRYGGRVEIDVSGAWLAPGFMDPHLHLESTMLTPPRLAEVLAARGTTTVVADPHEIANVLGLDGIRYLIEASAGLPVDFFFMAPSCVPATHMETSGAVLGADDLATLLDEPRVLGLAEVMNFPGVINGLPDVLDKLARFAGRPLDGHAPLLSGRDLCAYVSPGIRTEHECTRLEEAREKLARGMRIFIREGSQAKNMEELLPLVNGHNMRRMAFCTDDRHPDDLLAKGHLDHILRRAVSLGLPAVSALTMSTLNVAEAFGLRGHGALAPGYQADVVVLGSLEDFEILRVFKRGREVAAEGRILAPCRSVSIPDWASPMRIAGLDTGRFELSAAGPRVRVIELIEGQILTGSLEVEAPQAGGKLRADPERDLARLVVVERHQGKGNIGHGLVKGFGLRQGALASSVAHDSHNVICAGIEPEDMCLAVESVARMGGGLAVTAGGRVLAELPLPLAGLMSPGAAAEVSSAYQRVKNATRETGCRQNDPFMVLSFLALPVIPSLKLTDKGLVDVNRFEFVPLFL
ncbi:MAG: adenine deaminase [Proteobacteria bacterium]|nr:adenine deaminase [Pseudomonadota bacterium]